MTPAEVQERLAAIGSDVNRACALLVSPAPANLDTCSLLLESASLQLSSVRSQLSSGDANPGSLNEAQRVHTSLRKAAALLENAAQFHQTWNRILGAMCSGYQAGGAAASVVRHPRMWLEG
jgi:hypothetical protein